MDDCKGINNFCYVCGFYIPKEGTFYGKEKKKKMKRKISITELFSAAYKQYYKRDIIENVDWAPNIVCSLCYEGLLKWKSGKQLSLRFSSPMIWTDPGVHTKENCYACQNSTSMNYHKCSTKCK